MRPAKENYKVENSTLETGPGRTRQENCALIASILHDKRGGLIVAEALDNDTIMKAACIQAAATALMHANRNDQVAIVDGAKKILEEMEKQGYFPG